MSSSLTVNCFCSIEDIALTDSVLCVRLNKQYRFFKSLVTLVLLECFAMLEVIKMALTKYAFVAFVIAVKLVYLSR